MDTAQDTSALSSARSELASISTATLTELRKLVTTGLAATDGLGVAIEQCERNDVNSAKSKISQLETELRNLRFR